MLNSYWTIEKIDLALQRGELAASCEMPIEQNQTTRSGDYARYQGDGRPANDG